MPLPPLELPLSRLQRWMHAVIEQPGAVDDAVASPAAAAELDPGQIDRVVRPSRSLTPVERVGVYQGMYLMRMVEALQNDYPAVAHFLGDTAFSDAVTRYVVEHPSRTYTLNRLGDRFPEFLAEDRGVRRRAFASDLARLERAVTEVFDAPESPAWPSEQIGGVPEDRWPGAVLVPIAAFRLGAFAHPVNAYFQSVKDDRHDHPATGRRRSFVAVYRKRFEVWRLDLSKPAHAFLRDLASGRPFGRAVARASRGPQGNPGEALFRWLRDWVAEGMFQDVRFPAGRSGIASPRL